MSMLLINLYLLTKALLFLSLQKNKIKSKLIKVRKLEIVKLLKYEIRGNFMIIQRTKFYLQLMKLIED